MIGYEYVIEFADKARGGFRCVQHEPVVRCRDCKYHDKVHEETINGHYIIHICDYFDSHESIVKDDGFCAWGRRKEDD